MDKYLVIITTVLVITQIIRVAQNTIQLYRQTRMMKKRLDRLNDVTNEDLNMQKEAYRLIVKHLSGRADNEAD